MRKEYSLDILQKTAQRESEIQEKPSSEDKESVKLKFLKRVSKKKESRKNMGEMVSERMYSYIED